MASNIIDQSSQLRSWRLGRTKGHFLCRRAFQWAIASSMLTMHIWAYSETAIKLPGTPVMSEVAVHAGELSANSMFALVRGIAFSADGSQLAVDAEGPTIDVWDWRRKAIVRSLLKPHGGNDFQTLDPLRFSPDGRLLANCEQSGEGNVSVRIWNASDGSIAKDITGGSDPTRLGICMAFDFAPDGKYLFVASSSIGGQEGNVYAYDTSTFSQLWSLQFGSVFFPESIAVSPDGQMLAVSGRLTVFVNKQVTHEHKIYLVSTQTNQVVKVIAPAAMGPTIWSPDGKRIIVAGELSLEMFSSDTGQKILQQDLKDTAHVNLRFTADGRYLVVSDSNGRGTGRGVQIWDGEHKRLLQEIPGNIDSLSVSNDGRYLALGTAGRTSIWMLK